MFATDQIRKPLNPGDKTFNRNTWTVVTLRTSEYWAPNHAKAKLLYQFFLYAID